MELTEDHVYKSIYYDEACPIMKACDCEIDKILYQKTPSPIAPVEWNLGAEILIITAHKSITYDRKKDLANKRIY